jgi:Ethanolamine utilization protein EutJ (predicted chaperonin)
MNESFADALKIARRIAEEKERLLGRALVDAACDAPPGASHDEIIALAHKLAEQRAIENVAKEMGQTQLLLAR